MAVRTLISQNSPWCAKNMKCAKIMKCRYLITIIILSAFVWLSIKWDVYQKWTQKTLPIRNSHAEHFVLGRDQNIYMYSAFVNPHWRSKKVAESAEPSRDIEVVITTLDRSRAAFNCCVLSSDRRLLFTVNAKTYFENIQGGLESSNYVARQLACIVPAISSNLQPAFVTLASFSCSSDFNDYLPIIHPSRVPGGIALCAKIAHSGGLDPEKVIEWVEVQRLLGVDKILIFDLGNPENLTRVFRYYQNLGILDVQPYELPGLPKNRSLQEQWKHTPQFNHDETMAVLECRQRMAGFDFIISHDVDEFIIPRRDVTLKVWLLEHTRREPKAAGFYFHTEFFITTWEPTNPEDDLMVTRYRKSTVPRWECYKYVYIPARVKASITHQFYPYNKTFTGPAIKPSDAILHHYRQCPSDTWGTCNVATNIDEIMTTYNGLLERVLKVRSATSTIPSWTPVKRQSSVAD